MRIRFFSDDLLGSTHGTTEIHQVRPYLGRLKDAEFFKQKTERKGCI